MIKLIITFLSHSGLHLVVRAGIISGLTFMFVSTILLMISQREIVTFFEKKDVIPLRAFLDHRTLNHHDNATVIFIQAKKGMLSSNRITSCGIEGETAANFEVLLLYPFKNYVYRFSPSLKYEEAVVFCYDLKLPNTNARPVITYLNAYNYPVHTETKSGLVVSVREKQSNSTYPRVLLCANLLPGTEGLIEEWIQYQKNLGIDFIHLYTQKPVELLKGRHSQVVYIDQWHSTLGDEEAAHQQLNALQYMDCLYRYQELFDYVLVYDTSDYFVPMIANTFNIKYYIDKAFHHKHTGSVLLRRVVYGVTNVSQFRAELNNHTQSISSNISIILHDQEFKEIGLLTKGIHKLSTVREMSTQRAVSLLPGYVTELVSPSTAYIVHIRNKCSLQCSL